MGRYETLWSTLKNKSKDIRLNESKSDEIEYNKRLMKDLKKKSDVHEEMSKSDYKKEVKKEQDVLISKLKNIKDIVDVSGKKIVVGDLNWYRDFIPDQPAVSITLEGGVFDDVDSDEIYDILDKVIDIVRKRIPGVESETGGDKDVSFWTDKLEELFWDVEENGFIDEDNLSEDLNIQDVIDKYEDAAEFSGNDEDLQAEYKQVAKWLKELQNLKKEK